MWAITMQVAGIEFPTGPELVTLESTQDLDLGWGEKPVAQAKGHRDCGSLSLVLGPWEAVRGLLCCDLGL